MTEKKRATDEELAEEARRWDSREITPAGWQDSPDAVPRPGESVSISVRLPKRMVAILKEFARRSGIGYQVLMKRWLDERIRQEHEHLREEIAQRSRTIRVTEPQISREAAVFDARNVRDVSGGQVDTK